MRTTNLYVAALSLALGICLLGSHADAQRRHRHPPRGQPEWFTNAAAPQVMDGPSFEALIQRIQNASFSSDRVAVVTDAAPYAWFSAAQIARIIGQMSFSSERTQVVDVLAPRLVDRQNGGVIIDSLTFSSERDHAREVLARFAPR